MAAAPAALVRGGRAVSKSPTLDGGTYDERERRAGESHFLIGRMWKFHFARGQIHFGDRPRR